MHSKETARDNREEGGDDVKSVRPLCPGQHTCYNGYYKGLPTREGELISKNQPQLDWSLKPDSMKTESLVMADQLRRREYVPGPCTHRPSSDGSRGYPKFPAMGPKVKLVTGAKS